MDCSLLDVSLRLFVVLVGRTLFGPTTGSSSETAFSESAGVGWEGSMHIVQFHISCAILLHFLFDGSLCMLFCIFFY